MATKQKTRRRMNRKQEGDRERSQPQRPKDIVQKPEEYKEGFEPTKLLSPEAGEGAGDRL